jgi:ADP-heptose:LPS heptosyltransferase
MIYLLLTWFLAPFALLRRLLSPRHPKPERILLIQTAKIGDYICTTPIIRALREHYPNARLLLLVNPLAEPLARHQPGADEVIVLPDGRLRGLSGRLRFYQLLRREHVDTTVCISPNLSFLLLPFLAGTQRRASILPNFGGHTYRLASPFLSAAEPHRQGRMVVETGMALLGRMGVNMPLPAKEVGVAPGASARVAAAVPLPQGMRWIGLGVSSGNKLKELGPAKLQALIRGLLALADDVGVVLIGSAGDTALAQELLASFSSGRVMDGTGQVSLEDLPALIDRLALYVGVDSGITYLADARSIPVVDIMGPADAEDQRPTGARAVVIRTRLPCAPCSHAFAAPYACAIGTRACVTDTDIPAVVAHAKQLLNGTSGTP